MAELKSACSAFRDIKNGQDIYTPGTPCVAHTDCTTSTPAVCDDGLCYVIYTTPVSTSSTTPLSSTTTSAATVTTSTTPKPGFYAAVLRLIGLTSELGFTTRSVRKSGANFANVQNFALLIDSHFCDLGGVDNTRNFCILLL